MRPQPRAALVFADPDMSRIVTIDQTGRDPVQTNEAKAAEHAFRAKIFPEKSLVAQSVLKRQEYRRGVEKRRNQLQQFTVRSGLHRNQNEIARPNFPCRLVVIDFPDAQVFHAAHS